MKLPLETKNIYLKQEFESVTQFFQFVTAELYKQGKIKDSYFTAISQREEQFPTGLNTGEIKVAIPHTDFQHANTTQVVITTLTKPLLFHQMDDPDLTIEVHVIILILFDHGEKQLDLLGETMKVVQNQALLCRIFDAKTPEEIQTLILN